MQDKICPLSFSFVVKGASPQLISPQLAKLQIRIGFPCIGEKCVWWDNNAKQCRLITIQMLLEDLSTRIR